MEQKFYRCAHCGNIIAKVHDSKVPVMCCGEAMQEIIPNTVDASNEKHIPEYTVNDNMVSVVVGSVTHPMSEEHYIEWISIQTNFGNQRKCLTPTSTPTAQFALIEGEEIEAVFAYCNLHGLWKK